MAGEPLTTIAPEEPLAAIGETTFEVLNTLEQATHVPAIVCDQAGQVLAASPNARNECAVASPTAPVGLLTQEADGRWTCTNTSCIHHARCATCPIPAHPNLPGGLQVFHCTDAESAETAAQLLGHALGADAEKMGLMESLSQSYEELHLIQSLASAFEEEIDHRMTFARILTCVRQVLPFTAAEIWSLDQAEKLYRCLLHHDGTNVRKSVDTFPAEDHLEAPLRDLGAKVLREDTVIDGPLAAFFDRILTQRTRPVVVLPLKIKSRTLGVLVLEIPANSRTIDSALLRTLETAARQTSLVLRVHMLIHELRANEGLRREIDIARQIQHSILPPEIPTSTTFDLFSGCVTAAKVGGDYYDFFELSEDEIGLLIADVSGHSVASGLVAMSFRSAFRFFLEELDLPIHENFARVNRSLHDELSRTGHFLSAIYATYHKRDRTFRYVNAGHHPPLIYNTHSGRFREFEDEAGLLIGVLPEWEYQTSELTLEAGDLLLLYTDGIIEAENQSGAQYELERLQDSIKRHAARSTKELYHYLLREVYIFQDEQYNQDDITLTLMKVS